MDRDLISEYGKQGGKLLNLLHSHFRFEVATESPRVVPLFKSLGDVYKGASCTSDSLVLPVTTMVDSKE